MFLSARRWRTPLAAITFGFLAACSQGGDLATAPRLSPKAAARSVVPLSSSAGVIISQVYGGGGNSGATLKNDFIELYNGGPNDVDLSGASVQYTSAGGTSWTNRTNLTGIVPAGHYFLIQEANGTGGTVDLPTPDVTGTIAMGAGAGKVALVNSTTFLTGSGCPMAAAVIDFVGYGTGTSGANCFEGSGPAPTLTNTTAAARKNSGRTDTNDNAADFASGAPSPRNVSTPPPATPVVTTVTVSPATPNITLNATVALTATALDQSSQPMTGVTFTWASANEAVATVDPAGVVTGKAFGTTTVTATAPNGVNGSATVTVAAASGQATNVRVSEFHYDDSTPSGDTGERIEIEGDVGGSVAGWSLALYNHTVGSTSAEVYQTITLSGAFAACSQGGTRGVLVFNAPGLQNGDHDGFALVNASGQVVEFLSYEGSFTAVGGPAAGLTTTDVGVAENNNTPAGRSLQRAGNGVWFGPNVDSFGQCNAAVPPPPQTGISFTGRLSSDPALPIGFQDQVFATLRDANTGGTLQTTFTWTSDTPSIMSVDASGVVTALAVGTGIIRATAADGTTSTLSLPTEAVVLGDPSLYRDPLAFGAPTDNTPGDEFRVTRPQYTLSYNKTKHTPNWVAYELSKANRGDLPGYRCDCFSVDAAVVDASDPGINTADYTGSGYDRGHMVRSNDRELAHGDQAQTYYMSNIVPQYASLNQFRWARLEDYLQTVAEGPGLPDVYIFAGPRGFERTIANGRVVSPTHTWKVAVVLPSGMSPAAVTKASDIIDVIAVDMPNDSLLPRDANWQAHRVTVDSVEKATGYDLLSALPDVVENVVESGDHAPTAHLGGTGLSGGNEGQTLSFDGSTSSDPDVGSSLQDVLSYQWEIDGQVVGIGPTLDHTFADNGTYQVKLVVSDKFGASDVATYNVTILNVAPSVGALAPASIAEGSTYTSSGTFTDPGADTWAATVDYGDGSGAQPLSLSGKSFSLSHTYANNGSFTVRVTVTETDVEAAGDSKSTTVTVTNVAPTIAPLADATILRGETYQAAGSFTDPGADTWSATVNYGDGAGATSLALAGKTFSLSHAYTVAGVRTVTVTVNDGDDTGSRTAQVTVLSSSGGVQALQAQVSALQTAGKLTSSEVGSLNAKLDATLKSIAKQNTTPAENQLGAFINEVQALQNSGRLSAADANALIAYAQRIIAAL